MNRALFYDTETTGLPLFNEPSEDPRQPHIVQLGACLVDLDTWTTLATLDVICRPQGWTIPADVAAIHGITTEHAAAIGVAETMAVGLFMELWEVCDFRVAHNETFDARLMRIALMRHGTRPQEEADKWKAGKAECTQILSTPILKLPPTPKMRAAGRHHNKSANLGEAFQFFTGKPLDGAHSALVDVHACMAVYRAIKYPETALAP
jgi:DNA polymerase-3 subunit epsilon